MKKTKIYGLVDPRNDEIKYVGQSRNIKERFYNHMYIKKNKKNKTKKERWINELKKEGIKPKVRVLKTVLIKNADKNEKDFIKKLKDDGVNLKNSTLGGSGNIGSNRERMITFTYKVNKNVLEKFKTIVEKKDKTSGEVIRELIKNYIENSEKLELFESYFKKQVEKMAKEFYNNKVYPKKRKDIPGILKPRDMIKVGDNKFTVLAIYDYAQKNRDEIKYAMRSALDNQQHMTDGKTELMDIPYPYEYLEVPTVKWSDRNIRLEDGTHRYWLKTVHTKVDVISKMVFDDEVEDCLE